MKRGYLQISFAWLFAIIVGAVIIFLAIYFSIKAVNMGQYEINTKTEKSLGIILNPLETGFQKSISTSISLPAQTRIYNRCDNYDGFGNQVIRVSQKSLGKWPEPAAGMAFENKYIFSEGVIEAKKFNVFSKPFELPFKVSDLLYVSSAEKQYCLVNSPQHIEDEIKDLKQNNENLNFFVENCPESDKIVRVCFGSEDDCDVVVKYSQKYIEKQGERVYFETDALMYAGIFSDKNIYECQVKRLMQRIEQLSNIYKEKAVLISQTGCDTNLNADLTRLHNLARSLDSSLTLYHVGDMAFDIENQNDDNGVCRLW